MTPTADYIGRPSTDIAALNSLRPTCECDDAGAPVRCGNCGLPPRPRPEPIGRIRVTCVSCGTAFECDHDDVWGFDDDAPIYMCGTCQRLRRFDYGA